MSKDRFYKLLIFGLLGSNFLLLYFHIKAPHHRNPKDIVVEKLHFDVAQIAEYDTLITTHRKNIKKKQEQILVLKNALYQNLIAPSQVNTTDSLINEIAALQKNIELVNYHHFEDIKKRCKPEQQADFNRLVKELAGLFSIKSGFRQEKH